MTLLPRRPPAALISPFVRVLTAAGVTPTMLTTVGFLGNVAAAVVIAFGYLFVGGVLVLVFSALDMLDGAVARATGSASRFGALYDSTLDRLSEAAVLAGIAWYYLDLGHREEPMLAIVAIVGSLMVSYVRARSEGLGQPITDGLFTRSERVVITGVALMLGWVRIALWLLAILTVFTTFQRVWIAGRLLIRADAESGDSTAEQSARPREEDA